jgi:hypothetical protein
MKMRFQELGIEIARPSQTTIILQNLPIEKPDTPALQAPGETRRRSAG